LKRLVLGQALDDTVSLGSLDDPGALEPLVKAVRQALASAGWVPDGELRPRPEPG
jgi:hypothetical protein